MPDRGARRGIAGLRGHRQRGPGAARVLRDSWGPCQIVERGVALLGYAAIGSGGLVLLATRTRPAAVLPGGHVVRLVTESRWVNVPLQARHTSGLGLGFRPRSCAARRPRRAPGHGEPLGHRAAAGAPNALVRV